MLRRALFMGAVLGVPLPTPLLGQLSVLQVEVSGGAVLPSGDFAEPVGIEGDAEAGATFGVHLGLTRGALTWFVGFSEHRFRCGQGICPDRLVSTGWDVGVRINILSGPVVPWLRIGTTAHIAQGELVDPRVDPSPGGPVPTLDAASDRGWGFEAGAGIVISVAERIGLNPSFRYGRFDATFDSPISSELRARYWAAEIGLVLGF